MLACGRLKSMKLPLFRFIFSNQPAPDFLNNWRLVGVAIWPQKDLEIWVLPHCRKWLGCFWGYHWCNSQLFWLIWILKSPERWTNICRRCTALPANNFHKKHVSGWKFDMEKTGDNLLIDDILMSKNLAKSSSYCLLLLGWRRISLWKVDGPHKRPACNRRLAPRLVSRRWDNLKTSLVQAVGSRWERTKQNGISRYIHDITKGIVKITWKSCQQHHNCHQYVRHHSDHDGHHDWSE